jgi:alkylated DNA repair protein (DNA oxidative demethylase)
MNGFQLIAQALDEAEQAVLAAEVMVAIQAAPPLRQTTPFGRPMSVLQTSLGPLGWTSDAGGYRYEPVHPQAGRPWPAMPDRLLGLWARHAQCGREPDSCLVNLYQEGARMGLHVDADEVDDAVPVLSISLGDTAIFRLGGPGRRDPTRSFRLASGDVCLLAGASRRAFHGVDRIITGSSRLIPGGGRINLTLRRARA